jgi:hypothetical protein
LPCRRSRVRIPSAALGKAKCAGFAGISRNTGARIAIGPIAGKKLTTGSDNIYIANPGAVESGTIRIGTAASQNAVFLAGIWGKTIGGPTMAAVVNEKGRLGVAPAPLAPQTQARTITRLRGRVAQLAAAVERLRKEARAGG